MEQRKGTEFLTLNGTGGGFYIGFCWYIVVLVLVLVERTPASLEDDERDDEDPVDDVSDDVHERRVTRVADQSLGQLEEALVLQGKETEFRKRRQG